METLTAAGRRNLRIFMVVVATAMGLIGAMWSPPNASASAYGCSFWGAKVVGNIPVATGQYCALIAGQGTYVDYVAGGFTSAGNVCNFNITAEFFNTSGTWYRTIHGPVQYRCTRATSPVSTLLVRGYVQRGFMCSTLKQNGARVTSVCHNIY